ncbi:hypothetical protein PX52LOC_00992 [Limnoglobus roseus]|uniref:Uncharacterized protein n=2 Tax=Limnoglobus roseus TaxID=2598579 RepID=A0A5C1A812_9BACT|nr:hypothetical protein PX52LOC_00992 [Limnoglobus roseus]
MRGILAITGFLAIVTAGLLGAAVARRSPPPSTGPSVEVAAAFPAPPVERPPPPADPFLEVEPPAPPAVPVPPTPPVPEPPRAPTPVSSLPRAGVLEATVAPAGRYKLGETVQQDLVVTRRSTFGILGTNVSQGAQYGLSSRITVTAVNADGSLVAEQTVVAVKLLDADPDVRADAAAALEKMKGVTFELLVGPTGEVTAVRGYTDPVRKTAGKLDELQSLRIGSILDADGWKELAGLTFFQPDGAIKPGRAWSKPAAHDWGALGSWQGKTNYLARGKASAKSPLEKIEYAHAIEYRPPAAGAGGDFPARIGSAEFKATAGGGILYDPARSRSTGAVETFYVRGRLQATVAGPAVAVEVEELQNFKLTLSDPAKGELVGKPPKK